MKPRLFILTSLFIAFISFPILSVAETAVTIAINAGPASTEAGISSLELIVPLRPAGALPLNVGDAVFFDAMEPMLQGEGIITSVYDTQDMTIKRAIILDHIRH